MSDLSSCPICYQGYDPVNKVPRLVPICGHTICTTCLLGIMSHQNGPIFRCPIDRNEFNTQGRGIGCFPMNEELVGGLQNNIYQEKCIQHGKPKDFVCLTEKKFICADCGIREVRTGHNVQSIHEIHERIKSRLMILEDAQGMIKTYEKQAIDVIDRKKEFFMQVIETRFQECIDRLVSRKRALIQDTEQFFDLDNMVDLIKTDKSQEVFKELFEELSNWKMMFEERIERIKTSVNAPIELLEEDITILLGQINQNDIKQRISLFEKSLDRFGIRFDDKFPRQIEEFCYFEKDDKYLLQQNASGILKELEAENYEEQKQAYKPEIRAPVMQSIMPAVRNREYLEEAKVAPVINKKKSEVKVLDYLQEKGNEGLKKRQEEIAKANFLVCKDQHTQTLSLFSNTAQYPLNIEPCKSLVNIELDELKDIRYLKIDFTTAKISRKIVGELSYLIVNCPKLISMEIDLTQAEISKINFRDLSYSVSKVSDGLQSLSMNLEKVQLSDESLLYLAQEVLPVIQNIKHLSLNISKNSLEDDSIIGLFEYTVPNLAALEILELNFNETQISNQVLNLINQLGGKIFDNLSKLDLWLSNTNINRQDIESLKSLAGKMKKIKTIKTDLEKMHVFGQS